VAGCVEQLGRLELAPLEVTLDGDVRPPGVLALEQLPARQRRAGLGKRLNLLRAAVAGELGERSREEQVACGGGGGAPGAGDDRGSAAPERRAVQDVVVHKGRGMDELDGRRRPLRALG
jgi:hypothetical protein